MADIAWTIVTVLLVIVSLIVVVIGFPGALGRRAKARLLRRPDPRPDAPRRGER